MVVVSEVGRVGELLRDAPRVTPDLILLNWDLPDFKRHELPLLPGGVLPQKAVNRVKGVVIASLRSLPTSPMVIVYGNQPEDRLAVLHAGADLFLYQGDLPGRILSILTAIQAERM